MVGVAPQGGLPPPIYSPIFYVEPCTDIARDCIETYIEAYIDIIKIIGVNIPDRSQERALCMAL